jgi:hypothetical protein
MRMLIQTQLSNYDTQGKFILECDSGWQMMMGRIRVMLEMDENLSVDVMCPMRHQLRTPADEVPKDLFDRFDSKRLRLRPHFIMPNALATRYDFPLDKLASALRLENHREDDSLRYDLVYLNDPMHLRNFRAMFFLKGGYAPKFVTHSHFIDDPDCPKFPTEASLWLGQCEAAMKSDWNFWQCESAMKLFFEQMAKTYRQGVVREVWEKSEPWDDGYSQREMQRPINVRNIRFKTTMIERLAQEKVIIFVPNRIGGKGRSSDYTNCGKFMFDHLPELANLRAEKTGGLDYVVICGNPSQKILNSELTDWCRDAGYMSLVPDALNRDEFRWLASRAHVAVGLYNQDSYGGTVARECIELGCLPFWCDNYEYASIAKTAGFEQFLTSPGLHSIPEDLSRLIDLVKDPFRDATKQTVLRKLHDEVRERCSYEETTEAAYKRMKDIVAQAG